MKKNRTEFKIKFKTKEIGKQNKIIYNNNNGIEHTNVIERLD